MFIFRWINNISCGNEDFIVERISKQVCPSPNVTLTSENISLLPHNGTGRTGAAKEMCIHKTQQMLVYIMPESVDKDALVCANSKINIKPRHQMTFYSNTHHNIQKRPHKNRTVCALIF